MRSYNNGMLREWGIRLGVYLLALSPVATAHLSASLMKDAEAVFGTDNPEEARALALQARKAGKPEGWYFSGRFAMLDYNFPEAQKCFGEFRRVVGKLPRARQTVDSLGIHWPDLVQSSAAELKEANQQFSRFQDIVVIDAEHVKRKEFFKRLRLPLSAGRVIDSAEIPGDVSERGESAFISEDGDFMMWTAYDAEADSVSGNEDSPSAYALNTLMEVSRLADGTMSEPRKITGLGRDIDFPFLSADGTLLYFSAEGENSAGGRDIFIASRDPQTGEYMQPVNAGFPFNSAGDDYLMAIDEENGVGWWATDRQSLPDDEIMLYVYILTESRVNFEGLDEEKRERGVLADYHVTWRPSEAASDEEDDEEGAESTPDDAIVEDPEAVQAEKERKYEELASVIRGIQPGLKPRRHDCRIPLPGMKFIYSVDDVDTPEQKGYVEKYIGLEREYVMDTERLDKMRRQYSETGSKEGGELILHLEKSVGEQKMMLTKVLSNLYRSLNIR